MNLLPANHQEPGQFTPDQWLLCGCTLSELPEAVRRSGFFQWRERCGLVQSVDPLELNRTVAQWLRARPTGRFCVLFFGGDSAQRLAALHCAPDAQSAERVGVLWLKGDAASDEEPLIGLLAQPDASVMGDWLGADGQVLVPEPTGDWPAGAAQVWHASFLAWASGVLEDERLLFDDNPEAAKEHVQALFGRGAEVAVPAAVPNPTDRRHVTVLHASDGVVGAKNPREALLPIRGLEASLHVRQERVRDQEGAGLKTVALQLNVKPSQPGLGRLLQLELHAGLRLPVLVRWASGATKPGDLQRTLYESDVPDLGQLFEDCRAGRVEVVARVQTVDPG